MYTNKLFIQYLFECCFSKIYETQSSFFAFSKIIFDLLQTLYKSYFDHTQPRCIYFANQLKNRIALVYIKHFNIIKAAYFINYLLKQLQLTGRWYSDNPSNLFCYFINSVIVIFYHRGIRFFISILFLPNGRTGHVFVTTWSDYW